MILLKASKYCLRRTLKGEGLGLEDSYPIGEHIKLDVCLSKLIAEKIEVFDAG